MTEGDLFVVPLPGDRYGGGKVLAAAGDVVRVTVAAVVWDCRPDAEQVDAAPRAVDHLALRPEALVGAVRLGTAPVRPAERTPAFSAWEAAPPSARPIVAAPFAVVFDALVGTAL